MIRGRAPLVVLLALGAMLAGHAALAQQRADYTDPAETRRALSEARQQGEAARRRAERLEALASAAGAAAERSASEAAAAAARIQQAQAQVAAQQAEMALVDRRQQALRARLAARRQPVLRLTAALQRLARRSLLLTLFHPGSVSDAMHLRAMLGTMVPEVSRRTSALRGELDRARALRAEAQTTIAALREEQRNLGARRAVLQALETRQRLDARQSAGVADREAERALALGENARDLDALAADLGRAGELRAQLARLPGPVMRPPRPEEAVARLLETTPAVLPARPVLSFLLPVQGRLVAGFGEAPPGQPRSRGVAIAARPGAQAVAPAPGRVAFAGTYRGFGQIVIIDHGQGWTSLVAGLSQLNVRVGEEVVAGSPLGAAGPVRPVVTLEVRKSGQPVNPLDYAPR
ncbi:MAG: peptidoglycan DD-metalloendopeptidase family protein [Pseudomonadota bacterium]